MDLKQAEVNLMELIMRTESDRLITAFENYREKVALLQPTNETRLNWLVADITRMTCHDRTINTNIIKQLIKTYINEL